MLDPLDDIKVPRRSAPVESPALAPGLSDDRDDGAQSVGRLFAVEWRPLDQLASIAAQWRALAARALEPNVFYEPAFARAAAGPFGAKVGAVLVWSADRRLLGLFPLRVARLRYGIPLPVLVGWTHSYAPLGTPLVDRDQAVAVIGAFLAHVANAGNLPDLVLLPFVPLDGPFAQALSRVIERYGGRSIAFGRHARAVMRPGNDRATYLERTIPAKKRKELRRQRRRLEENAPARFATASNAFDARLALNQFLALEARGWKGRANTAAACDRAIYRFVVDAVTDLADEGKARVDRLVRNDATIAAGVTLRSGDTAWFWKIAYDEDLARFSPGVQLTLDLSESLLADATIAQADSCASHDHHMIDHLWGERLVLADHLISVAPRAAFSFALAARLEAARRAAIALAKSARRLVRAR